MHRADSSENASEKYIKSRPCVLKENISLLIRDGSILTGSVGDSERGKVFVWVFFSVLFFFKSAQQ